jgi:leucyl aminopeptidase
MKKLLVVVLLLAGSLAGVAQVEHLHEHDYPAVIEESPAIRSLMNAVSEDSIKTTIEHLCSYYNRRCDSRFIYDVQDWLVTRYDGMYGIDTVMLHDFKIDKPGFPEETADNILAIQWGTTTPQEFVVCGAHYDSWNDGADPDTVRSPGADDNASGVAGIIETARILSHYTFDRSIIYGNWCAEEIGLVGSAAYAHDMAEQRMDIVAYFNLDMTGYLAEGSDIHVNLMYTTQDSLLGDYVKKLSHVYFPEMRIWQDWLAWGDSDYSSFNRNGYPAIHPFEDVHNSSPFIHSRQDVLGLSVNNLEQCKRFTELNLGAVAILAGINGMAVSENELPQVTLYPNPAKEKVDIRAEDGLLHITVYNLLGQQTLALDLHGENKFVLNTNNYRPGVYVVNIVTEKGVTAQRLIVQ